ncbi:MAG: hypothetical protein ACW98Y_07240 [Candidatus Thorarchaeota archaeon]
MSITIITRKGYGSAYDVMSSQIWLVSLLNGIVIKQETGKVQEGCNSGTLGCRIILSLMLTLYILLT